MRPFIALRRRVFLGCEGESEQSYGKRLEALSNEPCKRFHFHTVLLQPGAGDASVLIRVALAKMRREEARYGGAYEHRAILLDSDTRNVVPDRMLHAIAEAGQAGVLLIWQDPCHEALLLRHLEGNQTKRPRTARQANAALLQFWPVYRKPMSAASLSTHIDRAAVRRAAAVEDGLCEFLNKIGFSTA